MINVRRRRLGPAPRRRGLRSVAALAAATVVGVSLVAACGSTSDSDSAVTLLTHDSFELPDSVLAAFRQSSGLDLKIVKSGDAGQLASTVSLTPGSPKADVVYGIDNTFASRVVKSGALQGYAAPDAGTGANDFALPNVGDQLTAVDRGDVCLNVDQNWYSSHHQDPPKSLRDLRDPRYAQQAALIDPATSSPGLAFLLTTIGVFGDGWQGYWKQVAAGGADISSGWETAYNQRFTAGEGKGDKPIVLSYASSPAATPGTTALLDSCFRDVEYAGVLKGAANTSGARKVVDFMLSAQVQKELPTSMYVYPVRKGIELPAGWAQRAPLPQQSVTLPPDLISVHREAWLQQWRGAVGR